MSDKLKFPEGFLWGVATSSYQIEGGNSNSDWWEWEKAGKAKDQSGKACDYWNRYQSDHDLLEKLGVNSFRLSLEWSRIEPEEGKFSEEALCHYREILEDLKKRGIHTQVTFWWWTSPIWFQKKYGFHKKDSVKIFSRYVEKASNELGELIDMFQIFNEPMVPLGQGFLTGIFPPGYKNPWKFWRAVNNLAQAYVASYKIIHSMKPEAQVGITYLYNWFEASSLPFGGIIEKMVKWLRIDLLGKKIKGHQDYFGLNYYRLGKIELGKIKFDPRNYNYFGLQIAADKSNAMEWVTYPEGMYKVIREAWRDYNLPIYITENGMPSRGEINDEDRIKFIEDHLFFIEKAIKEGIAVRGYNHWSLFDNLEWLYGYEPRFGLVEIDYKTLERKPRKSFEKYAEICRNNGILEG